MLYQKSAYVRWVIKFAPPTLSYVAAQQFFVMCYDEMPSPSIISREVAKRLEMSRKEIMNENHDRNEPDRADLLANDPLGIVHPGVLGAPGDNNNTYELLINTASKLGSHTRTDRGTCPGVGL
jgi:hypothetical protein